MRPSYCTPLGADICEISAGRGGEGAGAGLDGTFMRRGDERFLVWIDDKSVCDMDCERSCVRPCVMPGGANVGVLAVVNARVVVELLGCEKETRTSSLPSHRCMEGLYTIPFSAKATLVTMMRHASWKSYLVCMAVSSV